MSWEEEGERPGRLLGRAHARRRFGRALRVSPGLPGVSLPTSRAVRTRSGFRPKACAVPFGHPSQPGRRLKPVTPVPCLPPLALGMPGGHRPRGSKKQTCGLPWPHPTPLPETGQAVCCQELSLRPAVGPVLWKPHLFQGLPDACEQELPRPTFVAQNQLLSRPRERPERRRIPALTRGLFIPSAQTAR